MPSKRKLIIIVTRPPYFFLIYILRQTKLTKTAYSSRPFIAGSSGPYIKWRKAPFRRSTCFPRHSNLLFNGITRRGSHEDLYASQCISSGVAWTVWKGPSVACTSLVPYNDITSARNVNSELPVYYLKAKQGYTVRKTEKDKWICYISAGMKFRNKTFRYSIPAYTCPFRALCWADTT
jgi:hypothetical protein